MYLMGDCEVLGLRQQHLYSRRAKENNQLKENKADVWTETELRNRAVLRAM